MNHQLHIVANADPKTGGEGLAALRYSQAIAKAGGKVILASCVVSTEETLSEYENGNFRRLAIPAELAWPLSLWVQYRFFSKLLKQEKVSLVHLHGAWSPILAIAAYVAWRLNIRFIISPHGCLEPWALNHKSFKKMLALKTYQGLVLRSASLFVATADQEMRSLRRLGFKQPVAVIPNGVDMDVASRGINRDHIKTLLFLSRLHPKKGVLDLVNAWAEVRRPGWKIVIAGGDEEGYRGKVEALIQEKGLEADFELVGFVYGEKKQNCFDEAAIFILPTHSENFGIAVAEALSNGLPVITTEAAPWSDLIEYKCGWWVQPGVLGISTALTAAMECSPDEMREMGANGRKLVAEKYSWNKIGETAFLVSMWTLNQSRQKPKPVFLFTE